MIAAGRLISQGGKRIRMDMLLIKFFLSGLEGSYARASMLPDKNWQH